VLKIRGGGAAAGKPSARFLRRELDLPERGVTKPATS
jgi:hypothetical protein